MRAFLKKKWVKVGLLVIVVICVAIILIFSSTRTVSQSNFATSNTPQNIHFEPYIPAPYSNFDYLYSGNNDSAALLLPDQTIIDNVRSFASDNGHLYVLQQNTPPTDADLSPTAVLLKDNVGILKFNLRYYIGINNVEVYPNCGTTSAVCIYDNQNYLAMESADTSGKKSVGYKSSAFENIYYPNGLPAVSYYSTSSTPSDVGGVVDPTFSDSMDLPFVFSSGGDTYLIYYTADTIYGEDVSAASPPIKLFEVDSSGYPTISQLRVFPKTQH
jgi:hypothetical protein